MNKDFLGDILDKEPEAINVCEIPYNRSDSKHVIFNAEVVSFLPYFRKEDDTSKVPVYVLQVDDGVDTYFINVIQNSFPLDDREDSLNEHFTFKGIIAYDKGMKENTVFIYAMSMIELV